MFLLPIIALSFFSLLIVIFSVDGLHLPVIVSFPHFHMAADKYKSAIIGLDNDTSQYETLFYLEPVSIYMYVLPV